MNTFHLARIVLLVVLGISLSSSSPFDRLKRSLDEEADPGCGVPGVWACGKRSAPALSESQLADQTVPQPAKVRSSAAGCGVPGVWTCLTETAEKNNLNQFQEGTSEVSEVGSNFDNGQSDEPEKCPLGNLTCRRKRLLKKMLKHARRVERSASKCPPGIWVC